MDSILYHPFITYTFLLSTLFALIVFIYLKLKPAGQRVNSWIFLFPLGIPVAAYLLNYGLISKTCGIDNTYIGAFAGFPSIHIFCRINSSILYWIGPVSLGWLLIALTYTLWKWVSINRFLNRLSLTTAELPTDYISLCAEMKVRPPELLLVNTDRPLLFTAGIMKKFIIVSSGSLELLKPDELRAALAHELAHVRRRGTLLNRLLLTARDLTLFSPASSWAFSQFHQQEELECDALAASETGLGTELASALAKFIKNDAHYPLGFALPSLAGADRLSLTRVKMLLTGSWQNAKPDSGYLIALFLLAVSLLLLVC